MRWNAKWMRLWKAINKESFVFILISNECDIRHCLAARTSVDSKFAGTSEVAQDCRGTIGDTFVHICVTKASPSPCPRV